MSISGSPKAILTELHLLKEMGHNTIVVSNGGPLVNELKEKGISHYKLPLPLLGDTGVVKNGKLPFRILLRYIKVCIRDLKTLKSVIGITKIIRLNKIEVIQLHQPGPTLVGAIAAILLKMPYIIRVQHILSNEFPPPFHKFLVNQSRGISVITPEIKDHLVNNANIKENLISIIPTAVNMRERKPFNLRSGRLKILSVSTFGDVKYKAIINIINAVKMLLDEGIDCELNIIGDGPYKEKIYKEIQKLHEGLRNRFNLLGSISNIENYFNENHVVVGVGRVAMEALYHGKPLLCCSHFSYGGIFSKDNARVIANYNFSGRNFGSDTLNEENIYIDLLEISKMSNNTLKEVYDFNTGFFDMNFDSTTISRQTEKLLKKEVGKYEKKYRL